MDRGSAGGDFFQAAHRLQAMYTVIDAEANVVLRTPIRNVAIARQVGHLIEMGPADLAQVARHTKISECSLRRKLETEGKSFSKIRDRARRRRLEKLPAEPNLAIKGVAYLLGCISTLALTVLLDTLSVRGRCSSSKQEVLSGAPNDWLHPRKSGFEL